MKTFKALLLLSFIVTPGLVLADEPAPFQEDFNIQIGYFLPQFGSELRVDNDAGRGTEVNLEDRLGFNKTQSLIWGSAAWRFAANHRVEVGVFNFLRNGNRQIDRQIEIGDKTYPIGASLSSSLKMTTVPITYLYSFIKNDKMEFAGTIGLQWSQIKFNVTGNITTNPADVSKEAVADGNAPLPVIGVDLDYYIDPKWSVGGSLGAFLYKVGTSETTFQGYVATATARGGYWFNGNLGVGAALNWFKFNVDVDEDKWHGNMHYQYWGPQLYMNVRF